jgi:hypothetical protein
MAQRRLWRWLDRLRCPHWETELDSSGNPRIPALAEAMREALTPEEAERYTAYLRPLVEEGRGTSRRASAYLWARKG